MTVSEEYSAILPHKFTPKLKDLRSFTLPCLKGNSYNINILIDSGVSINLMPLNIYMKLRLGNPKEISISFQLVYRSIKHP